MALLGQGFAREELGHSSTLAGGPPAPASLKLIRAGSVMDLGGTRPRSASPRPRTVALTFDDGPDATWTPQILVILERNHIPATFFVVGSRVVTDPGLVRREISDGDEVGSHTFTHVDLGTEAAWRRNLELSLTQSALAGAAGIHTALIRLASAAADRLRSSVRIAHPDEPKEASSLGGDSS